MNNPHTHLNEWETSILNQADDEGWTPELKAEYQTWANAYSEDITKAHNKRQAHT